MPLKRTPHWATREFHDYLLAAKDRPFEWGQHDCCLSAANAIQSFTGVDLASDFRGLYTDEASAFALINTVTGGTTVADAAAYCANKHGLVERPKPLFAQRGDLVVIANGDTLIAGVVHLSGRHVVSVNDGGMVRLPISKVTRSWAV
jgi:hypothetical protein